MYGFLQHECLSANSASLGSISCSSRSSRLPWPTTTPHSDSSMPCSPCPASLGLPLYRHIVTADAHHIVVSSLGSPFLVCPPASLSARCSSSIGASSFSSTRIVSHLSPLFIVLNCARFQWTAQFGLEQSHEGSLLGWVERAAGCQQHMRALFPLIAADDYGVYDIFVVSFVLHAHKHGSTLALLCPLHCAHDHR